MSDFKSHPSYNARYKIGEGYIGFRSNNLKVNTISFQPRGVDMNEDRVVTKLWQFNDQRWMFLAVFDGAMICYGWTGVVSYTDRPAVRSPG